MGAARVFSGITTPVQNLSLSIFGLVKKKKEEKRGSFMVRSLDTTRAGKEGERERFRVFVRKSTVQNPKSVHNPLKNLEHVETNNK